MYALGTGSRYGILLESRLGFLKDSFTLELKYPDNPLTPTSFKIFISFLLHSKRNEVFEENIPGFFFI